MWYQWRRLRWCWKTGKWIIKGPKSILFFTVFTGRVVFFPAEILRDVVLNFYGTKAAQRIIWVYFNGWLIVTFFVDTKMLNMVDQLFTSNWSDFALSATTTCFLLNMKILCQKNGPKFLFGFLYQKEKYHQQKSRLKSHFAWLHLTKFWSSLALIDNYLFPL